MKFNKILLVLTFIITGVSAQVKQFKKGLSLFDQGNYDVAIKELLNVKDISDSEKGRLFFTIAESYRLTNRLADAAPFYERAIGSKYGNTDLRYHWAMGLKTLGKYEEADKQLQLLLRTKGISRSVQQKANREIASLRSITDLSKKTAKNISVRPLSINTGGAEFSATVLNGDLVFSGSRKKLVYANGLPYVGLYKAKADKELKEIGIVEDFSANVFAEDRNEGSPIFSKDGKIMVFARGNSGQRKDLTPDVDLYISKFDGSAWSQPEMIAISDSASWDGSPAFSADGKSLYFASNRFGGQGGLDIWTAKFDAATLKFSKVTNLGKAYNTSGNEMFPFMDADGKLYFASDGHAGLGRLDLFVANRLSGGRIQIENMGMPFNSSADDFGLVIDANGNMIFGSDRTGGQGSDDLYMASKKELDQVIEQKKEEERLAAEEIRRKQAELANQKQVDLTPKTVNYFLAGTIYSNNDKKTPISNTRVKIIDEANGNTIKEFTTSEKGRYGPIKVDENKDYLILTENEKFLTKRENFSLDGKTIPFERLSKPVTDTTLFTDVLMDKLVLNKAIKLENIYYDLNKYDIREDAAIELDKLVQVLEDNPGIKIELGSHTDTRSSDVYNIRLSQNRAQSAVNYIISRGVERDRLRAKGYGETQLIIKKAQNEEEHQVNRRTEFKIIELADGSTEEEEELEEEN